MRTLGVLAVSLVLSVSGEAIAASKAPRPLTADYVKAAIELKNDALEPVATFDTLKADPERLRNSREGAFLRAFVNKRTGSIKFQVYAIVGYSRDWRFYNLANYDPGDGAIQVPVDKISREVISCRYGCMLEEHVGFGLPEALVRKIAARDATDAWRFRLKSQSGIDTDLQLDPGEFAGLIAAVDEFKSLNNLPQATPAN
jgi:hypothetical protein